MEYILGVDGGNTKTDYFLFTTEGNFVDFLRGGTCSHEGLKDSFLGTFRVLEEILLPFLKRNKLDPSLIKASVFGLAGVDTLYQKAQIEEVIRKLGFVNYRVINDSFLGIKAGTPNGVGVCSINGTGTSSGGIDDEGSSLQVGGIGFVVGDEAGGSYIARQVIRAAYDEAYRFGAKTSLSQVVMDYLKVDDKKELMDKISFFLTKKGLDLSYLTIACFDEASKNDQVALNILIKMADNLARSAGGVVSNLNFTEPVQIVMAGSVWVKSNCPEMISEFSRKIQEYTKKKCVFNLLKVPPATGAVIWALELVKGSFPTLQIREKIIREVSSQLEQIETKSTNR